MSQENVEIVRRWSDSWGRRDVPDLLACFNDEIEVDFSNAEGPFRGIYKGRDDVIRFCWSLWEAWEVITFSFDAAIDSGDECLVTANVFRARGRTSGINVEAHGANLWTFHEGRISRCKLFQTTDEALEAAGLSE
jgi:ketosteroid isomerase-like protein